MENLHIEAKRLETFATWHVTFINPETLALLGFYYLGPCDMVKCIFCGVEIGMWEENDDILTDHMRWSPSCEHIRRMPTNNVPIDQNLLNRTLPPLATPDVYGTLNERAGAVSEGSIAMLINDNDVHVYNRNFPEQIVPNFLRDTLNLPVSLVPTILQPVHPEFTIEANRIKSFKKWPKSMRQKPNQLADAGFFYTAVGDHVKCFSCSGILKDWEENDDPWEQHAIWYKKCAYLNLMRKAEFVLKMAQKRNEICHKKGEEAVPCLEQTDDEKEKNYLKEFNKKGQETLQQISDEGEKKDFQMCKICFIDIISVIFLPCYHVVACAKCASSVNKCPTCRGLLVDIKKVYF